MNIDVRCPLCNELLFVWRGEAFVMPEHVCWDKTTDIEVKEYSGFLLLNRNEQGDPMLYGESMVEVDPGQWKTQDLIDIEEYLARVVPPLTEGTDEERPHG